MKTKKYKKCKECLCNYTADNHECLDWIKMLVEYDEYQKQYKTNKSKSK